jgi:hypothetical protein
MRLPLMLAERIIYLAFRCVAVFSKSCRIFTYKDHNNLKLILFCETGDLSVDQLQYSACKDALKLLESLTPIVHRRITKTIRFIIVTQGFRNSLRFFNSSVMLQYQSGVTDNYIYFASLMVACSSILNGGNDHSSKAKLYEAIRQQARYLASLEAAQGVYDWFINNLPDIWGVSAEIVLGEKGPSESADSRGPALSSLPGKTGPALKNQD